MLNILKKEITSYLNSLTAYITIGAFLLMLGLFLWVFPDTGILDNGYAALDNLFSIAPYLFMFLIPAITMRSLAEERREGTFELLLTRPLTDVQIVAGKYLAALILISFALIPTLIYYYTVYNLGNPAGNIDTGGVIGSYIGLLLLGSAFAAIGLFASSVSRNQIVAFTIAVFICFFFYAGFDSLSRVLLLQGLGLHNLGITEHYQSVSRGVLDTRDLAYFIVLAGIFLWLTLFVLLKQRGRNLWGSFMIVSITVLIVTGVAAQMAFTRFDFTKEKRYTISPSSRNVLDSLAMRVKVTVYLQGDNFPAGFKRLQQATKDMLSDLQSYSHGKLQFEFVDPLEGLAAEEQENKIQELQDKGIDATNLSVKTDDGLSQKIIFPSAMVQAGNRGIAVKLLQTRIGLAPDEVLNNSIQNLEYAFTSAIKKTTGTGKPRIGFTEGHRELSNVQLNDAFRTLSDGYLIGRVDINTIPFDSLKKINLLVIPKPDAPFTEAEKFKLDQYLMQGGRVLLTIDQVSAELDSLRGRGGQQLAFPKKLNLDDQLFRYGIRVNYDLLADMSCSQIPVAAGNIGGQAQIQMAPWLFYPVFIPLSQHPVVKNIDGIKGQFVSTIDTLATKGIKKTVLLTSSPLNKKLNAPYMLSLQALEQEPLPEEFRNQPKTTGVLLEGEFLSSFRNRPVPAGANEPIAVLPRSERAKIIVFSDGDIFKNEVAADGSPYPLGYDHYTRQNFANKNLLLNIADYMTDDSGLIELRGKELKLRLLDRARIRTEKATWQIINVVAPLTLVLIFAIFQHYLRRRRYAR
ncbi:gliding motility-associated ABC transporter substrate-binding protein GldG [Mucilaginibacter hurinus]|uniref:Gliding motility-associated ABC transporter substrate-binding protein GldG n=1 Tax=Mucilaginibacter hurinus TaxID=2201324 RepID=A0A367GVJ8_9SPHI|nr:gliding motility-associated ABC transporter substrate-binding protein GldG [Mucilaginibacter hurinus]RCH56693.1 gliding motility-associated ABC transporter substrate-binding protein GldG [Mucilaginibacter hurinus]